MFHRSMRRLSLFFDAVFRRGRLARDVDDELRAGFDLLVEQHVARGMSREEARRVARLEFEGVGQVGERIRDGLPGAALHTFFQDVRIGARNLRRNPSFAAVALITLALGIGVNTAVFSVFYAVLLRPLPYDRPEQLIRLWTTYDQSRPARVPLSSPILREIERLNRTLSGAAGIWNGTPLIVAGDAPEMVRRARVTVNFFDVLGVRAPHGRGFAAPDAGSRAVVVSEGFFRGRLGGDEAALRSIPTPERNIGIGVLPAGLQLYFAPDANVPADVQIFDTWGLSAPGEAFATRAPNIVRGIARLNPGVSVAAARQDLDRIAAHLRATYPDLTALGLRLHAESLHADAFGDVQAALVALFAGAAFVLLICCVNVTSLLLARAHHRRGEIAVRLALGASRGRLLSHLVGEAAVLCAVASAAGVAVGWAGFRGLLAIRPERFTNISDAGLLGPVIAIAAFVSIAATVLFALAPAAQAFRLDLVTSLRGAGRGVLGRLQRRGGNLLVAGEIALGFVLVTGAALAARTVFHLMEVRPGFEPGRLLAFQIPRSGGLVGLEDEIASLPGVERAGAISHLPLDPDIAWFGRYRPEGAPERLVSAFTADNRCVTPGFFSAMQTRLIEGRYFDRQDRFGSSMVAIVDETLARAAWPGQSAIGKRIAADHVTENGFEPVESVVVGVVEHIHGHSLTKEVRSQIYTPFAQNHRDSFPASFVVRSTVPPLTLVAGIRDRIRRRNPEAVMGKVRLMSGYVDREIAPHRFTAVLAAIFGGLALLLASTGIYGVLNYQISQRRREMGIRMAMGASVSDVLALVLREGSMLTAAGMLLGVVATVGSARWLGSLVHGLSVYDPLSYGFALLLLPAAALLGCWRPARQAANANPAETIRQE